MRSPTRPVSTSTPTLPTRSKSLQPFQDNGSVLIDGRRIRITESGRPYMRLVASVFDTYLAQAKSRHSVAV